MRALRPASLAAAGFALSATILVGLHLLPTGLDPTVNFVSEYATGPLRWLSTINTFVMAAAYAAMIPTLRRARLAAGGSGVTRSLGIASLALVLAATFPVESVEQAFAGGGLPDFSATAWIHVIAGQVGAVAACVAMVLIALRLRLTGPVGGGRRLLLVLAVVAPAAFVAMVVTPPATFPAGLLQRVFLGVTLAFFLIVSVGISRGGFRGAESEPAEGPT